MAKDYSHIKAITAWDEGDNIRVVCKTPDGRKGTKIVDDFEWYFTTI